MTCRTRFAPSPTGFLHIGGARTALYCWLEARRRGGQFVLRDRGHRPRALAPRPPSHAILDAMDWLGLDYDEGPIYQTQRLDRYREVALQTGRRRQGLLRLRDQEELDAMRERRDGREGRKPRYNGAYRERQRSRAATTRTA